MIEKKNGVFYIPLVGCKYSFWLEVLLYGASTHFEAKPRSPDSSIGHGNLMCIFNAIPFSTQTENWWATSCIIKVTASMSRTGRSSVGRDVQL